MKLICIVLQNVLDAVAFIDEEHCSHEELFPEEKDSLMETCDLQLQNFATDVEDLKASYRTS